MMKKPFLGGGKGGRNSPLGLDRVKLDTFNDRQLVKLSQCLRYMTEFTKV